MKSHLGIYSDWVEAAKRQAGLYPLALPGEETRRRIRTILGFSNTPPVPEQAKIETTWKQDGLICEAISWSAGYGPRTQAWFLRPEGAYEALPGVLALHGHDGFKFFGKEKVADGKEPRPEAIDRLRAELYEGAAFANELAKQGFAVLVHDVFLWGSRRFPFETMPRSIHQQVQDWEHGRKKLFTLQGMESAHARIASHYERMGQPSRYVGRFYDGPHKFDKEMQKEAFAWLGQTLK